MLDYTVSTHIRVHLQTSTILLCVLCVCTSLCECVSVHVHVCVHVHMCSHKVVMCIHVCTVYTWHAEMDDGKKVHFKSEELMAS